MTNEELERRTAEVRAALAAAAGPMRGRGRGYGAPARAMAVEHARIVMATGKSVRGAALAMGVHEVTLKTWLEEVSVPDVGAFTPVQVTRDEGPRLRVLSLVLPDGARVDGLDVTSAAALVRALR